MRLGKIILGLALALLSSCGQEAGRDVSVEQSSRETTTHLTPDTEPTMEDVKRLLEQDQKIAAIKAYRRIHGVGLADAKAAVEAMRIKRPEPALSPSKEIVDESTND